ncbi:hypothetical protein HYV31_03120 [candidate division WWE3 bacterium]|nr:hypothetical protein [candidate division WWE3 bacterium]
MPSLSLYIGESQVSALRYKTPASFEFALLPYVFLSELNEESHARERFFDQLIDYFFDKFKIKLGTHELYIIAGFGEKIPLTPTKLFETSSVLRASIQNYHWVFVENSTITTPIDSISYFPYGKDSKFKDGEFVNFISNRALYPQITTSNPKLQNIEDLLIQDLYAQSKNDIASNSSVIFTGSRFTKILQSPAQTYLFAMGLLNNSGFFKVTIDPANKLPLIASLDKTIDDTFEDEFINLGTVLKMVGGGEVLFTKESGGSQLVDIKPNQVFVFPLLESERAKVSVSGKYIGKQENSVRGGKLGFVLDSRDHYYDRVDREWVKVLEERLAAF